MSRNVFTLAGNISGVSGAGHKKTGAGTAQFTGTNTYSGPTTITAGILQLGNGGSTGTLPTGSAIANNATLSFNRSNTAVQGIDFTGLAITGSGAVVQTGTGTLLFNVANTYSGGTSVNTGRLEANNTSGSGTGSGAVTVASTGTFQGDGSITAGADNFVTINGSLVVGATGATAGTDFSIATSGVGGTIMGTSSGLFLDLWATTGTNQTANLLAADMLRLWGNLDILSGALLKLQNPNALTFQAGDSFKVIDWTGIGTVSGSWVLDDGDISLSPGTSLDPSKLYSDGIISVINLAPEPSRALLLCAGALTMVVRRRRLAVPSF